MKEAITDVEINAAIADFKESVDELSHKLDKHSKNLDVITSELFKLEQRVSCLESLQPYGSL